MKVVRVTVDIRDLRIVSIHVWKQSSSSNDKAEPPIA